MLLVIIFVTGKSNSNDFGVTMKSIRTLLLYFSFFSWLNKPLHYKGIVKGKLNHIGDTVWRKEKSLK